MRTLRDLLSEGYRFERRNGSVTVQKPTGDTYTVRPAGGSFVCDCRAGRAGRLCCHVRVVQAAHAVAGPAFMFCPQCGYPMRRKGQNDWPHYECINDIAGHTLDARLVETDITDPAPVTETAGAV